MTAAFSESAGAAYAELIEAELEAENDRRASIEDRGAGIVRNVGVIAGLVVLVVPFVPKTLPFPLVTLVIGGAAAIDLAIAMFLGMQAQSPRSYEAGKASELRRLISPTFWDASRSLGSRRVSQLRVAELDSARTANTRRARKLVRAFQFQLAGIAVLMVAALWILAVTLFVASGAGATDGVAPTATP